MTVLFAVLAAVFLVALVVTLAALNSAYRQQAYLKYARDLARTDLNLVKGWIRVNCK